MDTPMDNTSLISLGELLEGAVKQRLLETLNAYQNPDGTVDINGWLADVSIAFGLVNEPPTEWRGWAYYVIGQAELERQRLRAQGLLPWWDQPPYAPLRRNP